LAERPYRHARPRTRDANRDFRPLQALERSGVRSDRLAPWELTLPERVAEAGRLSAHGLSTKAVGRLLGISPSTVNNYLNASKCPTCRGPLVTRSGSRCHVCEVRSRSRIWSEAEIRRAERDRSKEAQTIIRALSILAVSSGRRPRWSDFHPRRQGLPSYRKIVLIFGSFNEALESAGIPPRTHHWTRQEVVAALQGWSRRHGRSPSPRDWHETGRDHPGATAVANLFGGWSAALAEAGVKRVWQLDEIVAALSDWTVRQGRPPTSHQWQAPDPSQSRPTTQQVRTRFGSWSAALVAAGLQPIQAPGSQPDRAALNLAG
jgi:Homing endonuclease associated repeat